MAPSVGGCTIESMSAQFGHGPSGAIRRAHADKRGWKGFGPFIDCELSARECTAYRRADTGDGVGGFELAAQVQQVAGRFGGKDLAALVQSIVGRADEASGAHPQNQEDRCVAEVVLEKSFVDDLDIDSLSTISVRVWTARSVSSCRLSAPGRAHFGGDHGVEEERMPTSVPDRVHEPDKPIADERTDPRSAVPF